MPMPAVVSALQAAEDEIPGALIYRGDHPGLTEQFHGLQFHGIEFRGVTEYERSVINPISSSDAFLSAVRAAIVQG
jgi:hypothetical protein